MNKDISVDKDSGEPQTEWRPIEEWVSGVVAQGGFTEIEEVVFNDLFLKDE